MNSENPRQNLDDSTEGHADPNASTCEPIGKLRDQIDVANESHGEQSKRVGKYKLLQKIGEGGMGVVWMAEQEEPVRRRVALKLIRASIADKQVIARFEAERQALAMMDHQNIAKVLDAGTTPQGAPFFVMELVNGIPISEYCDRNKLTPNERLELFVPVCRAVQHAHQKGVMHRDLKPSNVLVQMYDGEPVAKVIDFGLAKALQHQTKLTDKTMFTEFGQVVGTLQYMSPEQATMDALAVDTRTDIYSLGVMLYELLVGSTPVESYTVRNNTLLQVLDVIREKDPPKPSHRLSSSKESVKTVSDLRKIQPSRLKKILEGELDWIVMKCLEKDRTRRYATAGEFAQDIVNYLEGGTVLARPPSMVYQLRKFARKNTGLFVSLVTIGCVLLAGIGGTTFGLIKANQKTEEALEKNRIAVQKTSEAESERRRANTELERAVLNERLASENLEKAKIERAEREITSNHDLDRAFRLLDECSSKRGSWEWNYLMRRLDGPSSSLAIHQKGLWSAEFSPDGSKAVTASIDGTMCIWDIDSGLQKQVLAIPNITTSSGSQFSIRPWIFLLRQLGVFDQLGLQVPPIMRACFRPDGRRIASGSFSIKLTKLLPPTFDFRQSKGVVTQWDPVSGNAVSHYSKQVGIVMSVVYSPDGQRIASSTINPQNSFHVWDAGSLDTIHVFRGHRGTVHRVAFLGRQKLIVSVDSFGDMKLWRDETFKELKTIKAHGAPIIDVVSSPDGMSMATASQDGKIKIWSLPDCECVGELTGHLGAALGVDYSPDGKLLVSAGYDKTVRVWDPVDEELLITLRGHTDVVWTARFDERGEKILTSSFDNTARIWDGAKVSETEARATAELKGHRGKPNSIRLSPNEKYWATSSWDQTINVWSAETGKLEKSFDIFEAPAWGLEFKPDSSVLAAVSWDGSVAILDAEKKQVVKKLVGHTAAVHGVAFSQDGDRMVSAGFDGRAIIWDTSTWERISTCEGSIFPIYCAEFSKDGRFVYTGGTDRKVKLWNAKNGEFIRQLGEHKAVVHDLELDQEGRTLYSASWDNSIKSWSLDLQTGIGGLLNTIKAHHEPVNAIRLSPDGKILASASDDKTVRFWHPQTGVQVRKPVYHRGAVWGIAFTPDGKTLATNCWSTEVGTQLIPLEERNKN